MAAIARGDPARALRLRPASRAYAQGERIEPSGHGHQFVNVGDQTSRFPALIVTTFSRVPRAGWVAFTL